MRFLLISGNNSLSHLAMCLSLESSLTSRRHPVVVAVSRRRVAFVEGRGIDYRLSVRRRKNEPGRPKSVLPGVRRMPAILNMGHAYRG